MIQLSLSILLVNLYYQMRSLLSIYCAEVFYVSACGVEVLYLLLLIFFQFSSLFKFT